jgi:Zn-dependent protease with chaperone function
MVHLAAGLALRLASRRIAEAALRMSPRLATRILLVLRWTPSALALCVVAVVCIPSYLWFEPIETDEGIGLRCLTAAGLALATWAIAFVSGSRKVLRSRRAIRDYAAFAVPVIAIAGIWRARLLISPVVIGALNEEQMGVALRHEQAHAAARDNLKRLLLAFTPGLFPGVNGLAALERLWVHLSEWAADDEAVKGDSHRALALASALVSVARLGSTTIPLASSIIDGCDLTERIDRLLYPPPPQPTAIPSVALAAAASVMILMVGIVLQPAALEAAHELMEQLVN